jgi:hypothetical protein
VKALWSLLTTIADAIIKHPVWAVCVFLVTTVSVAFTAIDIFSGTPEAVTSRAPQPPSSSSLPMSEPSEEPVLSITGRCFSGPREVPCDTGHEFQVYSEVPCTRESMVSFLGGAPSIEVLAPSVGPVQVELAAQPVCAVSPPADTSRAQSADGILQTSAGESWRRCIDDRTEAEVPCSGPHTGEVVYEGIPPTGEDLDCVTRAERYLEAPLQRFSFQLSVETIEIDGHPGCIVVVLGANLLTGSIRSVGTSTLPISAQ